MWSQMSYSFVKTGGSGEAYDILAEDVQGKVFFAGEVRLLFSAPSLTSCSTEVKLSVFIGFEQGSSRHRIS